MTVFPRSGERHLITLNKSLNAPAEPPNSTISELCHRSIMMLLIANFLIYIFPGIDHFKLAFKVRQPDGFLTS
ncbi:MAG: hypothetical protein JWP78_1771 [Mucilaginibacter sp.]|nr:hypothetical protein [Mucilaginibacter sp.]